MTLARILDSENLNSRLWALSGPLSAAMICTQLILCSPRSVTRQANLSRALRYFEIHPFDESVSVGLRLADSETSDVVDAHLTVVAEGLGTFILTTDHEDMTRLNARFERY